MSMNLRVFVLSLWKENSEINGLKYGGLVERIGMFSSLYQGIIFCPNIDLIGELGGVCIAIKQNILLAKFSISTRLHECCPKSNVLIACRNCHCNGAERRKRGRP